MMSDNNFEFTNPDNLPVEKLILAVRDAGVVQQILALDAYWVEKRELTIYERPPVGTALVVGALDAWKTKMEVYIEDVKWLLGLEHHRFWSTILHHPNIMDMLVSFLQEANPPYMQPYESQNVQKLYEEIRKLVLIAFSRLITNKESKSQWMSKDYMSSLIYDKFIFTIPILWDACLVYGADNTRHIARLVESVLTTQPKYLVDFEAAIEFVKESFKYIILQVNKDYDNMDPPNLPETFKGFGEIRRPPSGSSNKDEKLTFSGLRDLVIHLLDTSMTLRIFIEAYPKCVPVLKKRAFVLSIVQVYEHAIPHLYDKLDELGEPSSLLYTEVQGYVDGARAELIDVFREVLAVPKHAIFSGEGNIDAHAEDYISSMMEGLSERLLIRDYHACYPVHEDLELLRQACPNIDPVKTDFILQAIYSNLDEPVPNTILNNSAQNGHIDPSDTHELTPGPSRDAIPDNIREESLISEVKDILPHLGDGFILQCLKHYGFNAERVVNSILEDTLAESLRSLDRSLPIIPEDPVDNKFLETGIERLNVFDGDQFDIMTRDDVDLSKIHKGKKRDKYKNVNDLLDDKSELKKMVDIYSKYNLVCDEVAMYSDEYDDTYDSDGGSARDAGDDLGRPFVTPRALVKPSTYEESSDEDPEPQRPEEAPNRNRLDFCVNPEEMRARREAAHRLKQGKGHRPPPPAGSRDVTGKPRGQGQEKTVLVSRDKKEKSKSSRANHNRRGGAQWKRSQGMMPS